MNLLTQALSQHKKTKAIWYPMKERTLDDRGVYVNTYCSPITISGSFQPMSMTTIKALGLDLTKQYYVIYTSNPVMPLISKSPDRIVIGCREFDVISVMDWYAHDGWRQVNLVEIFRDEP